MNNNDTTSVHVLHVALECGPAIFGGLGRVATQMLDAQNQYQIDERSPMDASIIAPLYPALHATLIPKQEIAEFEHLYNNQLVKSKIYLVQQGKNKYYLIEPGNEYKNLFDLHSKPSIYADLEHSSFIERVKFFNSAVAAYVNNAAIGIKHPQPQILHLHDWQASLVPKLLKELHNNHVLKSVFMVHIDSGDRGSFASSSLDGIGLRFSKSISILKAIGLIAADKIVAVSPKFLRECIESTSDDPEMEYIRKIFAWASVKNKTVGISNGINFADFSPIGKTIIDANNVFQEKANLKQLIARILCGTRLSWKFDPTLPMILYVGRYSPEKGPEVFKQVIECTAGKATFVAVGRGMTDDVFRIIVKHSRQTDNVYVTASEIEQAELIEKLRAAADIILIPSHRDAFGLVGPEGLANGGLIVTTGVGGLKDIVTTLNYADPNNTRGNGIFYEDQPYSDYNPALTTALLEAISLWDKLTPEQVNKMQIRIMQEATQFDWNAPNGAVAKHLGAYQELIALDKSADHESGKGTVLPKISAYKRRRAS